MVTPSSRDPEHTPRTLLEKIWNRHTVWEAPDGGPSMLYVDLHLLHELTSRKAFEALRERGLAVRHPDKTLGTIDHIVPTTPPGGSALIVDDDVVRGVIDKMAANCREFGIPLAGLGSAIRGIVHVMAPELGLTQPGMTLVCGDSHTSTQGALGALAFGIGSSEVAEVLATQCLLQRRPKTFEVHLEGCLRRGVVAKDLILALLAKIGVKAGTGHVFEYTGSAVRSLSMEGRLTLCNMSIEGGARAGLIAPDDVTFEYLSGRPHAPTGDAWDRALEHWRSLPTDPGVSYHRSVTLDVANLEPMITYGTNPSMAMPVSGQIPEPSSIAELDAREDFERALDYMGLTPGEPIAGEPVDVVFLGSCTNSRLADLRQAASVLRGRRVAEGVRMLVVPGSEQVKREAEAERLDEVFRKAGAEWRETGCSMCIAMNGDQLAPGELAVSTTNRNFEGRQGQGGRSLLASPLTAAASAVSGVVADPRHLSEGA